jgi:hypothetical protein
MYYRRDRYPDPPPVVEAPWDHSAPGPAKREDRVLPDAAPGILDHVVSAPAKVLEGGRRALLEIFDAIW